MTFQGWPFIEIERNPVIATPEVASSNASSGVSALLHPCFEFHGPSTRVALKVRSSPKNLSGKEASNKVVVAIETNISV